SGLAGTVHEEVSAEIDRMPERLRSDGGPDGFLGQAFFRHRWVIAPLAQRSNQVDVEAAGFGSLPVRGKGVRERKPDRDIRGATPEAAEDIREASGRYQRQYAGAFSRCRFDESFAGVRLSSMEIKETKRIQQSGVGRAAFTNALEARNGTAAVATVPG